MKSFPPLIVALLLGTCAISLSQTQPPRPMLEYRFNGTGNIAANTGSATNADIVFSQDASVKKHLYSEAGTGVSGAAGDTALDNTGTGGMGSAGNNSSGASTPDANVDIGSLKSFTISGWYRASAQPDNSAKLFELSGTNSITVVIQPSTGGQRLELLYGGTMVSGNSTRQPDFASVGKWIFWAVTYDGTVSQDNLKYYIGTKESPVQAAGSRSVDLHGDVSPGASVGVGVGNGYYNKGFANRPFSGLLDDVRFFGSANGPSAALDDAQIERLRMQSLK